MAARSPSSSANVTYMGGNTRSREQRSTRGAAVPLALSFKRASQIIHFGMFRIAALHALEQLDCFSNNVVNYEEIQTLIQQNMVHLPSFAAPLVFLLSILFIPSLLIQLIWLYRASANIQEFQVQGIRFTPFLSVLLSCMPVVGMVLNALVLQEIYKASKNPAEWMLQIPSRSLRLYLLVTTALTLCTLFPFGAEHYVTAFLLTGVLMTAASILWLVCVLQITRKQEELVSKIKTPVPDRKNRNQRFSFSSEDG